MLKQETYKLIVEFAGIPNSGKTTLAKKCVELLQKEGYRVQYFKPKLLGSSKKRNQQKSNLATCLYNAYLLFNSILMCLRRPKTSVYAIRRMDRNPFYQKPSDFLYIFYMQLQRMFAGINAYKKVKRLSGIVIIDEAAYSTCRSIAYYEKDLYNAKNRLKSMLSNNTNQPYLLFFINISRQTSHLRKAKPKTTLMASLQANEFIKTAAKDIGVLKGKPRVFEIDNNQTDTFMHNINFILELIKDACVHK